MDEDDVFDDLPGGVLTLEDIPDIIEDVSKGYTINIVEDL